MKKNIRVLYEDNHLLALVKPHGVLSQGDETGDETLLDMGKSYLKFKYEKPGAVFLGLVHRLDRPTGGVILFARTSKAASRLSEQFRERRVRKTYLAICERAPHSQSGELHHFLGYDEKRRRSLPSLEPGTGRKSCELRFRVLENSPKTKNTLLLVHPKTGRKHQIRAQFSATGNPLLGDRKYGSQTGTSRLVKAIGLWACQLEFTHPVKKEMLRIRAFPDSSDPAWWGDFYSTLSSLSGRESF